MKGKQVKPETLMIIEIGGPNLAQVTQVSKHHCIINYKLYIFVNIS